MSYQFPVVYGRFDNPTMEGGAGTKYIKFVKKWHKDHPKLTWRQAMKDASPEYHAKMKSKIKALKAKKAGIKAAGATPKKTTKTALKKMFPEADSDDIELMIEYQKAYGHLPHEPVESKFTKKMAKINKLKQKIAELEGGVISGSMEGSYMATPPYIKEMNPASPQLIKNLALASLDDGVHALPYYAGVPAGAWYGHPRLHSKAAKLGHEKKAKKGGIYLE